MRQPNIHESFSSDEVKGLFSSWLDIEDWSGGNCKHKKNHSHNTISRKSRKLHKGEVKRGKYVGFCNNSGLSIIALTPHSQIRIESLMTTTHMLYKIQILPFSSLFDLTGSGVGTSLASPNFLPSDK